MKISYKKLLLLSIILFVTGVVYSIKSQSNYNSEISKLIVESQSSGAFDYDKQIAKIKDILKKYSYKEALIYAENLPITYKEYHSISHYIGQEMFKSFGVNGVAKCFDSTLQDPYFGCAHGFLSEAVRGTNYDMRKIEQGCRTITLGNHASNCLHIIGHSILHNLGFNDEAFIKANKICDQASDLDTANRCKDGTVMESTFARLGTDGRGLVPKLEFDPENPYYPCPLTDNSNCYTLKPEYWLRSLKLPVNQIVSYCTKAPNQTAQEKCFWGLGLMMWSESYVKSENIESYQALLSTNIKNCQNITLELGKDECLKGFKEAESKLNDGTYRDVKHIF